MSTNMTVQEPRGTLSELSAETLNALIAGGDLSRLNAAQCNEYYRVRCERAGLDPAAQPFEYLTLQGKKILYAKKGCTDQLASIHKIKATIVSSETVNDIRVVNVRAEAQDGRATEDVGAVNIKGMSGDNLANALMKAVTKAKRRTILSLCGLGMLDETELETIPSAARGEPSTVQPVRTLEQAAERAPAPARQVTAEVVQPKPSRPASAQAATEPQKAPAVDGPDFNAMPEYHEDGSVTVFRAVKVSAAVIKRWAWWKKDLAIDSKRSPNTKLVALKDRPWSEVIEGPVDGGRERALIDGVVRTAEDIRAGKPVIQWSEKAAWALHMMYDERLKQEQAQVDRQDAEEPMPFDAAPAGQGHERGDWTKGDPESTPF